MSALILPLKAKQNPKQQQQQKSPALMSNHAITN